MSSDGEKNKFTFTCKIKLDPIIFKDWCWSFMVTLKTNEYDCNWQNFISQKLEGKTFQWDRSLEWQCKFPGVAFYSSGKSPFS